MTINKNVGGMAFPMANNEMFIHGMTLRDYFAGQALPAAANETYGMDWGKSNKEWPSRVARQAYILADAMLAERDK